MFAAFAMVFAVSFRLYHLPVKAVIYPVILCGAAGLIFMYMDFRRVREKYTELRRISGVLDIVTGTLPEADGIEEESCLRIINLLCDEYNDMRNDMNRKYSDMMDYYTAWAHQVKTPISSMRLNLQNEDSPLSRKLSADLFRVEQYVEMVMMYLRLDSDTSDYVIKEYELDDIVRQAVKKFAGEFISRKLSLVYKPLDTVVVTDEKWLSFVIEQVLSNSLKYTLYGEITVSLKGDRILCISDTGMGIAPEDIPRIFEKGYTGRNGRSDKKASGLGLYLCRRICSRLGHNISIESEPDRGTSVFISLGHGQVEFE